jgi:plastocyanin
MLGLALPVQGASAATLRVKVEFQAFAPDTLDALRGDTVLWTNNSGRRHTVTADLGQFDSGDLFDGRRFSHPFAATGTYAYHCTVHRGMLGEVDVRNVTLAPLPPAAVLVNSTVQLGGRTVDPRNPVRVQRNTGSGFVTVTTATPAADGTWAATVIAAHTARYRAAAGPDLSETRRLLVSDRKLHVRASRGIVTVSVVPADPYARVALQLRLRDRFGWWTVARKRLDHLSQEVHAQSARKRARTGRAAQLRQMDSTRREQGRQGSIPPAIAVKA